jgi:TrpR-related protein YerC/YecD
VSENYENNLRTLFEAIVSLHSADEAAAFFDDLCTIKELQDMSSRFEVALLLDKGKNYAEISELTGASSATISRVNRCLNYGKNGYKTAIGKINNEK